MLADDGRSPAARTRHGGLGSSMAGEVTNNVR